MIASKRLNTLSESQTLALTKKVRELKAQGEDIVGLTLGEPDFNTPIHIREAGIRAIREGHTHYPPVAGIPELRQAIAQKFNTENGLSLSAENIVVSTGAKQAIVNAIMALVNPGEEVILIAPYWVSYLEMLKMAEAMPKVIHASDESNFKISPDQLEAAITENTKMVIFNSPTNPTGTVYSESELTGLASVFAKHPQLFILTDEIYEYLSYDTPHTSLGSFPEIAERVITINGFSKGYAMTGWRIGYLGATKEIASLCEKFQGQVTSGTSTISQWAALEAITADKEAAMQMKAEFQARRDWLYKALKEMPGIKVNLPEGAFYFYPSIAAFFGKKTPKGKTIQNVDDFTDYLLEEGKVAVIPGTAFGTEEHIRISYAYDLATLKKGAERIRRSLSNLK